ncbi:MAG: 2-C-methyl-D-erythritol 2,4-cyclodiphosphate synthase [Firmicutes bacterium]|nr:2-C-methyl-D-erythritol 2,4-cyclodiphosphate synthase [Bacillota bacterium]
MNVAVIIAAAGSSRRFNGPRMKGAHGSAGISGGESKVLLPLCGRPVLEHSIRLFSESPAVSDIVISVRATDMAEISHICLPYPKTRLVLGGSERTASVAAALKALADPAITHIAVHDGARPLLHAEDWQALLFAAEDGAEAALLAAPLVDSVKQVEEGRVSAGLDRSSLAAAQTPQMFTASLLRRAYAAAERDGVTATDDVELVQRLGCRARVVWARHENFKLTYPDDLERAEAMLARRGAALDLPPRLRVGQGWDSHRLAAGRPLILGGVEIPFEKGLLGHSDADVLTHAVIDALLGAAALPDIGRQFPDSDPAFAGISSLLLLERTFDLINRAGFRPLQLDATVVAQQPKLAPHIDEMRANLARCLRLPADAVSVKAKTAEGLDSVGRGEAMQAMALVLLERSCS